MEIEDLKKMLQNKGDRVVIIENGKPMYVVTRFDSEGSYYLNQPKAQADENQVKPVAANPRLTLEDLPFL